jgi:hypothetical protein
MQPAASRKSTSRKPPFVVSKIVYNDLHLFQSVPKEKCQPAKKTATKTVSCPKSKRFVPPSAGQS